MAAGIEIQEYDCTNWNECPKGNTTARAYLDKPLLRTAFFGCWGVYCKSVTDIHKERVIRADGTVGFETLRYGAREVAELLSRYSREVTRLDVVLIAGDNVYADAPSWKQVDIALKSSGGDVKKASKKLKELSRNVEKQIEIGFKKCVRGKVKADKYLVGIGNHDIATCDILNTQMNYNGWTMPGLYYNYVYNIKGVSVNFVFIDTNVYHKTYCRGSYPDNARQDQLFWLKRILEEYKEGWNIVIGHEPFIARGHSKKEDGLRIEEELRDDIGSVKHLIDLYANADEHNKHFIMYKNFPPVVIAGSGGATLDTARVLTKDELDTFGVNSERYHDEQWGFVGFDIDKDKIMISYYSIDSGLEPQYVHILTREDRYARVRLFLE